MGVEAERRDFWAELLVKVRDPGEQCGEGLWGEDVWLVWRIMTSVWIMTTTCGGL